MTETTERPVTYWVSRCETCHGINGAFAQRHNIIDAVRAEEWRTKHGTNEQLEVRPEPSDWCQCGDRNAWLPAHSQQLPSAPAQESRGDDQISVKCASNTGAPEAQGGGLWELIARVFSTLALQHGPECRVRLRDPAGEPYDCDCGHDELLAWREEAQGGDVRELLNDLEQAAGLLEFDCGHPEHNQADVLRRAIAALHSAPAGAPRRTDEDAALWDLARVADDFGYGRATRGDLNAAVARLNALRSAPAGATHGEGEEDELPRCLNGFAHDWEWTDTGEGDEEVRCVDCKLVARLRGAEGRE